MQHRAVCSVCGQWVTPCSNFRAHSHPPAQLVYQNHPDRPGEPLCDEHPYPSKERRVQ